MVRKERFEPSKLDRDLEQRAPSLANRRSRAASTPATRKQASSTVAVGTDSENAADSQPAKSRSPSLRALLALLEKRVEQRHVERFQSLLAEERHRVDAALAALKNDAAKDQSRRDLEMETHRRRLVEQYERAERELRLSNEREKTQISDESEWRRRNDDIRAAELDLVKEELSRAKDQLKRCAADTERALLVERERLAHRESDVDRRELDMNAQTLRSATELARLRAEVQQLRLEKESHQELVERYTALEVELSGCRRELATVLRQLERSRPAEECAELERQLIRTRAQLDARLAANGDPIGERTRALEMESMRIRVEELGKVVEIKNHQLRRARLERDQLRRVLTDSPDLLAGKEGERTKRRTTSIGEQCCQTASTSSSSTSTDSEAGEIRAVERRLKSLDQLSKSLDSRERSLRTRSREARRMSAEKLEHRSSDDETKKKASTRQDDRKRLVKKEEESVKRDAERSKEAKGGQEAATTASVPAPLPEKEEETGKEDSNLTDGVDPVMAQYMRMVQNMRAKQEASSDIQSVQQQQQQQQQQQRQQQSADVRSIWKPDDAEPDRLLAPDRPTRKVEDDDFEW